MIYVIEHFYVSSLSIRLSTTPNTSARAVPLNANVDPPIAIPLIPRERTVDTIIKFFWLFRSVCCNIFTPEQAM